MGVMARAMGLIVLGLALMLAANPVSAESEMSREELQKLYVDYLKEEGYRPEVDEDGDVVFKREGFTYFINVNEKDQTFFSVVLPNIWPIESEEERLAVFEAADVANGKAKVTKVFTMGDDVWVATELFIAEPKDFKGIFLRAVTAIENAADIFADKMRE